MKRFTSDPTVVTIREVAKRAEVSVATASYALNDTGRVAAETKKRVLSAAEELGYSPSIAAQMLKGGKGNLIAILTDGFAGPWYGEILEGLQPAFKAAGFAVLAITIQKESLLLCRNLVAAGLIQGIVVLNPEEQWAPFLCPMMDAVPTAVFDPSAQYDRAIRYVLDNREGITALMTHLWDRGYRDYLWLDGDLEVAWDARERYTAFQGFLDDKELSKEKRRRSQGGFKTDVAERAVSAVLSEGRIPRVIVAANDESAIGALNAIRRFDFTVPRDIAVAGFDGLDIAAWMHPALTTLRFDRRALGQRMAGDVLRAIDDGGLTPAIQTIPLELLIREST